MDLPPVRTGEFCARSVERPSETTEHEALQVPRFRHAEQDRVIERLAASLEEGDPGADVSRSLGEHAGERRFVHVVRTARGHEDAPRLEKPHGAEIDLLVAAERLRKCRAALRERGRIEDDRIEAIAAVVSGTKPIECVRGRDGNVGKTVPARVRLDPRGSLGGDLDRGDLRARECELKRESAGVAEDVEAPPLRVRRRGRAILALIEEEAGLLSAAKIDLDLDRPVTYDDRLADLPVRDPHVARQPLEVADTRIVSEEDSARPEKLRQERDDRVEPAIAPLRKRLHDENVAIAIDDERRKAVRLGVDHSIGIRIDAELVSIRDRALEPAAEKRFVDALVAIGEPTKRDLRAVAVHGATEHAAASGDDAHDGAAWRTVVSHVAPVDPRVSRANALFSPPRDRDCRLHVRANLASATSRLHRTIETAMPSGMARALPRVVIVGGGFGGLSAARALRRAPVEIRVIDRRNHHLFQPLLYQVATAGLSATDIAYPIRAILRRQENAHVLLGEIVAIDVAKKRVALHDDVCEYDYLIVATGATHAYFGHEEWAALAPGLKTLDDALAMRRKILLAFELAERAKDPERRRALLTFVIVGAGPTGVELAGAIAEISRQVLVDDFREIDPREARVLLVEAGPRVLPPFPEDLSAKADASLRRLGVEVRTGTPVTAIDEGGATIGNERIAAGTVLWAAGVAASPLAKSLGVPLDRAGRVLVERDLSIPGHPEVFVIGDLGAFLHQTGKPLPGVAQVAIQQGEQAAKNVIRLVERQPTSTFRYNDKGNLATIGRAAAVAQIGRFHVAGFVAWLLWLFVHVLFLIGFRNRVIVMFNWAWAYITFQRGARVITGDLEAEDVGEDRTRASA